MNRIPRNTLGVKTQRRNAMIADLLAADTEVAVVKGQCWAFLTDGAFKWLEAKVDALTLGMWPQEKQSVWEQQLVELADPDVVETYEKMARNGA